MYEHTESKDEFNFRLKFILKSTLKDFVLINLADKLQILAENLIKLSYKLDNRQNRWVRAWQRYKMTEIKFPYISEANGLFSGNLRKGHNKNWRNKSIKCLKRYS